jgi:hypothetical protein
MSRSKIETLENRINELLDAKRAELQALEAGRVEDEALCAAAQEAFEEASEKGDFDSFKRASDRKHEADMRTEWRLRRKKALTQKALITREEANQMIEDAREEASKIDKANRARVADMLEKIIQIERENTEIINRKNDAIKRMKLEVLHESYDAWNDAREKNVIRDFIQPIIRDYQARGFSLLGEFRK